MGDPLVAKMTRKLGRYEIVRRLARGAMSDVWLARVSGVGGFERHIAVKQVHDDVAKDGPFIKTFVAEARRVAALHHHNIVQVEDIGEHKGTHYIAMEYVHGEDLRALLARLHERGAFVPIQHVLGIGIAIASALHHAHEQLGAERKPLGIVHRDLSLSNLRIGYDGNVKVVDFGIAKALVEMADSRAMLRSKVPYMAPEQCAGRDVDRRADVFALGVVLYELATSRRLFKAETEFLTMAAILGGTPPRPSVVRRDLPADVERMIMKALARDPKDRWQSADELRSALEVYAVKQKLALSATSLADYMKQLFGTRPEPWLDESFGDATDPGDFDGAKPGLAQAPNDALETFTIPSAANASEMSPIRRARERAVTGSPTAIVPLLKKPVPIRAFASGEETTIPRPPVVGKTPSASSSSDLLQSPTKVTSPPPAPPPRRDTDVDDTTTNVMPEKPNEGGVVATAVAAREPTAIVAPLEFAADGEPKRAKRPSSVPVGGNTFTGQTAIVDNRKWIMGGVAAVVAVIVVGLVLFIRSSGDDARRNEQIDLHTQPAQPPPGETKAAASATTETKPAETPAPTPAPAPEAAQTEPPKPAEEPAKPEPPPPPVRTYETSRPHDQPTQPADTNTAASEDNPNDLTPRPEPEKPAKPEPAVAVEPPKPPPVKKVPPTPKPPAVAPKPPPVVAVKPPPKPPAKPKPPAPPAKPAKPPTWDPDSLFLKKP